MKVSKIINWSIFILSVVCLLITCKLFINLAIYTDEFNTSPDVVLGGELWLYMNWLKIIGLGVLSVLSGINVFKAEE